MSVSKDQTEGRVKQAKGTIKEVAGKSRSDGKLEARGKVQEKYGDMRQYLKQSSRARVPTSPTRERAA